jgi:tetratricopeptide (TPR) repeat protein
MRYFQGDDFAGNDLPIMTLATDRVTFPVDGVTGVPSQEDSPIVPWQRWNDYGIGLLLEGNAGANKGELRQAEAAFAEVETLGRPDGPLNRARVYIKEGRLDEAVTALQVAAAHDPPAPPWSVAWFTGLVNNQNGHLDEAIQNFVSVVTLDTAETRRREFDFSQDYRVLNQLGQTVFERAKQERGPDRAEERKRLLVEAVAWFRKTLALDPENVTAHYNLGLLYAQLGDKTQADAHRALHAKYKPDDNARDRAIAAARRKVPSANHAAEAVVIYDLQRAGADELPATEVRVARDD